MSDITVINDSEQSSLVTNGLAKNGELYLKAAGSTDAGAIVVYDSGSWRTFANEAVSFTQQYSLSFDNTDDQAKAASSLTLSKDAAWSFSFWFNIINGTSDYDSNKDFMSDARIRFRIVQNLAGTSSTIRFYDDSGWRVATTNSTTFNFNNSWHNILITSDGTNAVRMYVNGIQQTGGTGTLLSDVTLIGPSTLYVMGNQQLSGRARAFDEIAVFNSDLSSSASAIYNSGVATDLTSYNPLIWWRMEEGSGSTVADSGTDGSTRRDLTLFNSPTFITDTPS